MICGYKCFNSDMTNLYGDKFEVGKSYSVAGEVKVGTTGNGFHMCINIEDTLRYFGAMNEDITICEVKGFGEIVYSWDDYYGYEKYAVQSLEIIRIVSREEIIEMALKFYDERAIRFVQLYKLTPGEIVLFENTFSMCTRVLKAIDYYQKGKKDAYQNVAVKVKKKIS